MQGIKIGISMDVFMNIISLTEEINILYPGCNRPAISFLRFSTQKTAVIFLKDGQEEKGIFTIPIDVV